ncbi:Glutaminase [Dissostichus eleginoides]|uniref:Glutaminase n=1 Tax=Dissostichus eleginoides TaxID=100907 RepID=A0AAD9CKK7_DISEL|nr:Glutaminase [Dissostichus eleginoides]
MESLTGSPQLLLLLVSEEQHGVADRKSSAVPPLSLRNNMESLTGSPQLLLLLVSEEQHGVPDRKSSAAPPPRL